MKFSLVVPCFNESESLGLLLETLKPFLISKFGESWEVIFVDDGSRYLFIVLYLWLEKYFSRGDYRKNLSLS